MTTGSREETNKRNGLLRGNLVHTYRNVRWMHPLLSFRIIRFEAHQDHSENSPSPRHRLYARNPFRKEIRFSHGVKFARSTLTASTGRGAVQWQPRAVFEINIAISGGLSLFFRVVERLSYQGQDLLTVNKTAPFRKLCLIPFNIPCQPPSL